MNSLTKENVIEKYNSMTAYLNKDNEYWMNNDVWDMYSIKNISTKSKKTIDFTEINNNKIKREIKYSIISSLNKEYLGVQRITETSTNFNKYITTYIKKHRPNASSLLEIQIPKFQMFLLNTKNISKSNIKTHMARIRLYKKIIEDFYDDREETEKDVWCFDNIPGAKKSATSDENTSSFDFTVFPKYYREDIKRYFKTLITKRSICHLDNVYRSIKVFFNAFYTMGYKDGFLETLARKDIEEYMYYMEITYAGKSRIHINKLISYSRMFLHYIQLAEYKTAPKKDMMYLIFDEDIPKREPYMDTIKKVKYIPAPILEQLDANISKLDRPDLLPIYILLRETGWRGTDILNLRYDTCIEQKYNNKEEKYNYYLCGEITKTGIASLQVPIRDEVATIVIECINKAKELSTDINNPKKYLFNVYSGRRKTKPISKKQLLNSIERLIKEVNISDANGNLYHFNMHALRHTRAKEYVEQGMNIKIVQELLGHRSLQMTIHYSEVDENTLYNEWSKTEKLNLFNINISNNQNTDNNSVINYTKVKQGLDAVKVPLGICFKSSKISCKNQSNACLNCGSFCTSNENISEYDQAIEFTKKQINIGIEYNRLDWIEQNKECLKLLENMKERILKENIIHKNSNSREDI